MAPTTKLEMETGGKAQANSVPSLEAQAQGPVGRTAPASTGLEQALQLSAEFRGTWGLHRKPQILPAHTRVIEGSQASRVTYARVPTPVALLPCKLEQLAEVTQLIICLTGFRSKSIPRLVFDYSIVSECSMV